MAENETDVETESSVVKFTDEHGRVNYAGRHSKAYQKHLARQKATDAETAAPTEAPETTAESVPETPTAPEPAASVRVVGTDPAGPDAALADKPARTARKAEPKS